MTHNIATILGGINGSTFASIDTTTSVKVSKKTETCAKNNEDQADTINALIATGVTKNPFDERVVKHTTGTSVILFSNSKSNGYENMVKRRLTNEGKDPNDFVLSPPKWGTRIEDTPIIEHNGEYYLEVILQKVGTQVFLVEDENGKFVETPKENIFGLPKERDDEKSQGGLETKVMICRYKLSSITGIRANGSEYAGEFVYEKV